MNHIRGGGKWNMNSIRGGGKHITIKVWKIYNGKIEAVSFVIKSNRKWNWPPRYDWNIVESGVKHPNPNTKHFITNI